MARRGEAATKDLEQKERKQTKIGAILAEMREIHR
jgi:hypothetical protein